MSKFLKIKNEKISEYLGTDDLMEGLEKTVDNGQTRLALQIVVDLINDIVEKIADIESKLETKVPNKEKQVVTKEQSEVLIIETDSDKKASAAKEKTKEVN